MEECEATIRALSDSSAQLEDVRVHNTEIKEAQKAEVQHYITTTQKLKVQKDKLEEELRKYEVEEEKEMNHLEQVRGDHDSLRDKMERSLNDLTHGIRLYASLG
jgi:hypothetical protein